MSFAIGQKVVCVNDRFNDLVYMLYTALPVKDKVYVIRDVRLGVTPGTNNGAVSVLLVGLKNPHANSRAGLEFGFDADRFRALDEMKDGCKRYKVDAGTVVEGATIDALKYQHLVP